MVRRAIRSEGRDAEDAFVRLVPGSQRSDSKSRGDVIVAVDGKNYYVEVKSCHAAVGEQATADQVRPIKYNACVVRTPKRRCWYVMSPDQLVSLAGTKNRGQHCEIPFECLAISLNSLPRFVSQVMSAATPSLSTVPRLFLN